MTDPTSSSPYQPPDRRQPAERIRGIAAPREVTLADYWAWSSSDLLSNVERGIFAEYLVALALGQADGVRDPWSAYDLLSAAGTAVEVKSAAFLQRWTQARHSTIRFGIGPSTTWDPHSNRYVGDRRRRADVYVFCLLAHRDPCTVEPLDLTQWRFFCLSRAALDTHSPDQKSIGLAGLSALGATEVAFDELADAVERCSRSADPRPGS